MRTIHSGIGLESRYQVITVIAGFGQHGYVSSMEQIKRAERDSYALALAFECFDVIEYHANTAVLMVSSIGS